MWFEGTGTLEAVIALHDFIGGHAMSLVAIILIILLLGGLGAGYPYGGAVAGRPGYWGGGYGVGGLLGLVLVVVLVLALLRHI